MLDIVVSIECGKDFKSVYKLLNVKFDMFLFSINHIKNKTSATCWQVNDFVEATATSLPAFKYIPQSVSLEIKPNNRINYSNYRNIKIFNFNHTPMNVFSFTRL